MAKLKVSNKNEGDPYFSQLEEMHDFNIQEYQQKLVDDNLKSKDMDKKKKNTKYSLNLMMMNDPELRDRMNKAFNMALKDPDNLRKNLTYAQEKFREKYDVPDADLVNIHNTWMEQNKEALNRSEPGNFNFLDTNIYDTEVKKSEDRGYGWLTSLSDDELSSYIEQDSALRAKYDLTSAETRYESMLRSRHAAADAAGKIKTSPMSDDERSSVIKTLQLSHANKPAAAMFGLIKLISSARKRNEAIRSDLYSNDIITREEDEYFKDLAKKEAKKANKNKLSDAVQALRYIDSAEDLEAYYRIRDIANKGSK